MEGRNTVTEDMEESGLLDLSSPLSALYQLVLREMADLATRQGGRVVPATAEQIARNLGRGADEIAGVIERSIKGGILEEINANAYRFANRQRLDDIAKEIANGERHFPVVFGRSSGLQPRE